MKKIAIILSISIILSMLAPFATFAAVADDSTDGQIVWQGYTWNAICESSYLANDQKSHPCTCGYMYVDDSGLMHFELEEYGQNGYGGTHFFETVDDQFTLTDNFNVEFDFQMKAYGEFMGFQIELPDNKRLYLTWDKTGLSYRDGDGANNSRHYDISLGYDVNTFRFEGREENISILLNGEVLTTLKYESSDAGTSRIRFYSRSSANLASQLVLSRLEVETFEDAVSMTPADGAVFEVGNTISLTASVDTPSSPGWTGTNSTTVSYYIGDFKIGEKTVTKKGILSGGGTEGDYTYTLSDLPVGSYQIRAEATNGQYTFPRTITVKNPDRAVILSGPASITYGDSAEITFNNTSGEAITNVSYYVNGNFAETLDASPYTFTASNLRVGSTGVYAVVLFADGISVTTDTIFVDVTESSAGSFEMGQEYELNYTYQSGEGTVLINDGYFECVLKNTENSINYESRDGSETYSLEKTGGAGNYKVVVASGIAEVYRNGQLIFSDYLPRSSANSGMSYSGVSNVTLSGSGVKNELLRCTLGSEKQFTKEDIKGLGVFYSLEFDKTDASSESILLYDGEYEISLKFNGGIVAKTQSLTGGSVVEKTIYDDVKSGYYRLTVYRGLAQLFCDNKFLASFRAPKVSHKTSLRRVMSGTGKSTFVAIKNTDDIYYFGDDFEGTNELSPLEYWYDYYGTVAGTISGGKMTVSGDGIYLLDATAENPKIKWDMTVVDPGDWNITTDGDTREMSIVLRYRNEFKNIKLKYSHTSKYNSSYQVEQSGTWTIVEADGEEEIINQSYTEVTANETEIAAASYLMSLETSHTLELSVESDKLTLTCDNTTIFSDVQLSFLGNGKFGFDTGDFGSIRIDNVSYAGNGKVNSGINYTYWVTPSGTPSAIEGDDEGEAILNVTHGPYSTTDQGDTWTKTEVLNGYSSRKNYIKLDSGNYLNVYDTAQDNLYSKATLLDAEGNVINTANVQHSGDGMLGRYGMGRSLIQGTKVYDGAEYPRVFYVATVGSEESGEAFVYYSDDEGRTWEYSKTRMTTDALEETLLAEPCIVELPDHTIRVYARTDKGFVYSIDSFDGGVNFDKTTFKPTQFISPSTCFSICRDEDNPNIYYMIWEYEPTTAYLSMVQLPRSRTAVAVSYDGCESWEYILEADDRGPVDVALHHANNNMSVVHGVAYATSTHLYKTPRMADEDYIGAMTYAIDSSKMKSLKRFTNVHYVQTDYEPITNIASQQVVLPKSTGTAMIFGEMFPAKANDAGFVENAIVAKAVGATVSSTTDGVRLSIGDGYVDFTKNSASYSINGTSVTAAEICLSEDGEYLNPEVMAQLFAKTYKESTQSHLLLSANLAQEIVDEIESLVVGVPETLNVCIEEFKSISSWEELKTFFTDYKYLLNLYTSFSDTSYKNMYTAYTALDTSEISDYETLDAAIQTLIDAEKGRIGEFLDAVNAASSAGDGAAIKTLLTDTYKDMLSFTIDTSDVKNDAAIYEKMTGLTYSSVAEVENVFLAAHEAQIYAETGKSDVISLSTASRGFEGWSTLAGNSLGGTLKFVKDNENVTRLSAHAGLETDKEQVEDAFENGLCYYSPGAFDESVTSSGITVDTASGTATFTGADGTLTIKGSEKAKSNTMITVFDMTKPEGTITGNFYTGNKFAYVDFTADGTSVGELSDTLKAAENLTYRVEMSLANVAVFAKAKDAADATYELVGTTTSSNNTKTAWEVTFDGDGATATLSNIGIYSALSSVRYETTGYTLQDSYHYTANGTDGSSMDDFVALSEVMYNNVTVNEDGILVMAKNSGESNSVISFSTDNGRLKDVFERSEIDFTVSIDTGGKMFFYLCDSTGYRYKTGDFAPNTFNNTTTNVGLDLTWETGQFYDFKIVTTVVDYDETGKAKTSASIYVKKTEETDWICLAHDQFLTNKDTNYDTSNQIQFLNTQEGKNIYISDFSLKTYKQAPGEYSFINTAVNMPTVDYIFSFDYRRLDPDSSTELIFGGSDYSQTFKIHSYGVESEETDGVFASVDINEDAWYRFFGKVKMKTESVFSFDTSKRIKNEISLYMMDADGNVTTLFEDLPMLKVSGKGGIRFTLPKTSTAGIELKNIRVYNGRALDIISYSDDGATASITADFLNNETALTDDSIIIGGVYNDGVLKGVNHADVITDVREYGVQRVNVGDIMYSSSEGVTPEYKLFMWKDFATLIPITNPATSN